MPFGHAPANSFSASEKRSVPLTTATPLSLKYEDEKGEQLHLLTKLSLDDSPFILSRKEAMCGVPTPLFHVNTHRAALGVLLSQPCAQSDQNALLGGICHAPPSSHST